MILYEYPFNERIRTYLRLQQLFNRLGQLMGRTDALDHHFALTTLFEIIEVATRSELKSDVLKDLERQRQLYNSYRGNPAISEKALSGVMAQLDDHFDALNQVGAEPAKVNFAVDHVYGVLVQAVCFDAKETKTRTTQVEEFAKVDDQWMLAACSVRDEKTRDADLLRITEAALGERFLPAIFEPATLTAPATQPANFKKL